MSEHVVIGADGVEQIPLKRYTEKAYLDYSMYVILDRALPSISDGLRPVQRRRAIGRAAVREGGF